MKQTYLAYFESCRKCNVSANELKRGDEVEDINPDCKHYKATGKVIGVEKINQDPVKVAGKLVKIRVDNTTKNCKPGDVLKKTEIQLRKI